MPSAMARVGVLAGVVIRKSYELELQDNILKQKSTKQLVLARVGRLLVRVLILQSNVVYGYGVCDASCVLSISDLLSRPFHSL